LRDFAYKGLYVRIWKRL